MTLEELKNKIESEIPVNEMIVFEYSDSPFICYQYINAMSSYMNKNIEYIDSLNLFKQTSNIFGSSVDDSLLYVYRNDEIEDIDVTANNLIVVTHKTKYKDKIKVPKLEEWQLLDIVNSFIPGLNRKDSEKMAKAFTDVYRLSNEIDKVTLFDATQRTKEFAEFLKNNVFVGLTDKNVFDFINYLLNADKQGLIDIYQNKDYIDLEPLGIVTLLYNKFRNFITVCGQMNPTEQNTGISSKMIWATKKTKPNWIGIQQMTNIFKTMCKVQNYLITGRLNESQLMDYCVIKILSEKGVQ